jgi:hypothetical protein
MFRKAPAKVSIYQTRNSPDLKSALLRDNEMSRLNTLAAAGGAMALNPRQ